MIGNTSVETEYIGRRRDFKNSYFVSFKQMLITFGRIRLTAGLTAIVAIQFSSVRFFLRERKESFFQAGASHFDTRDFEVARQKLSQDALRPRSVNHQYAAVILNVHNSRQSFNGRGGEPREAADLLSSGASFD